MAINVNSGTKPVFTMADFNTPPHDYVSCSYTGSNLTQLVYKTGGASGDVVSTITVTYNANNQVTAITKV